MQKNEGSKVVKWILIAVSVLFAFVFYNAKFIFTIWSLHFVTVEENIFST